MVAKRYFVCVFALSLSALLIVFLESKLLSIPPEVSAGKLRLNSRPALEQTLRTSKAFSIPIAFEPGPSVAGGPQFLAHTKRMTVALVRNGIEVVPAKPGVGPGAVLSLRFLTSSGTVRSALVWHGSGKLCGQSNYFLGADPRKWRTHVPRFERAEADIGGVGLIVYGNDTGVEYDVRLPPGRDSRELRVAVKGARDLRIDQNGDLIMRVADTEFRMRKPRAYEESEPRIAEDTGLEDARHLPDDPQSISNLKFERSDQHRSRNQEQAANSEAGQIQNPQGAVAASNRPRKRRRSATGSRRRRGPTAQGRRQRPRGLRPTRPKKAKRPPREAARRSKAPLHGHYVIAADGTIGFYVGHRDPRATLVIDPTISITYSSFLGGAGTETVGGIAVDPTGKVYVSGTTTSPTTFPETSAAQLGPGLPPPSSGAGTNGSAAEFFVAKIDPSQSGANSLVYLTFVGGSSTQTGGRMAIDSKDDVAVTGTTTSPDFPVTDGSARTSGANNTTLSEIDPTGSKLIFSTLFGGNGAESQQGTGGITIDTNGNVFVASDTNSSNLPASPGAYATAYQSSTSDGFLAIFQPNATPALKYCTYLGLTGQVGVGGVAVDATGEAYVAGFTNDPNADFPTKSGVQSAYGGGNFDAFLMKFSPTGAGAADLVYATLLGGSGSDEAFAVAVDSVAPPNAYVTGTTASANFPTNGSVAAFQTSLPSNAGALTSDTFLTVIAQNASTGATSLVYSTYLGGSQTDTGLALVAAEPYAVYVVGTANSWDFPWHDNLQPFNGHGNAFVAKLDTTTPGTGSLIYTTPLGGTSPPGVTAGAQGTAIAVDASGNVWAAGQTTSADFPSAGAAGNGFQLLCASCQESPPASDSFIVSIQQSPGQLPSLYFAGPGIPLNFGKQALGTIDIPPQFAAIKNSGEAALNISSIGISGPDSGDFSLSGASDCAPATISPSGICSFEVNFTPSIVGPEGAFVQVTSNAPGNPQVLQVFGTGVGLSALPGSLTFGKQLEGTMSPPQSVTLTNTTSETLFIDAINESGPNTPAFQPASGAGACVAGASGIAGGASCEVSITFAPPAAGTLQAQVNIQYHVQGLPEQQQIVQLSGTGLPPAPVASLQPASLNFGTITVDATAQTQVVTLTNTGSAALNLSAVTLTGPSALDFGIVTSGSTPCPVSSGSIAINADCTVGVEFTPKTAGVKSAALSFADNATGNPQTVALSGTAQAPPAVQITPASLNFSSESLGTKSVPQQITITNAGGAALAVNGISLTGANAADFAQTNNCPPAVAPNASCIASVTFQPTAAGARTAAFSIADDGPNSPQTVALSGTGTQPAISFSPAAINFGNQAVGTPSAATAVTVTNSGTGALVISKISFTGTNAGDFSESDNCTGNASPNGVAPSGTCTIQVTFTPACGTVAAARAASFTVADNAASSPQSVALSGTGTGNFCLIVPSGDSTTASIAPGQNASYNFEVEAANGFTGNVTLACAGAPAASNCALSPATVNVGGSTLAMVQVNLTTAAGGVTSLLRRPVSAEPFHAAEAQFQTSNLKLRSAWPIGWVAILALAFAFAAKRETFSARPSHYARLCRCASLFGAVVLLGVLALAGCGGGGSGATSTDPGTPAGTYTITVTGTGGGASQSLGLMLTVQ